MGYQIVTRSTDPQVVDLTAWREQYQSARSIESGDPVKHTPSPALALMSREEAIEKAIRNRCHVLQCSVRETAAAIECGIRKFRAGFSAAAAIEAGQKRARELAWGTARPVDPKGAA